MTSTTTVSISGELCGCIRRASFGAAFLTLAGLDFVLTLARLRLLIFPVADLDALRILRSRAAFPLGAVARFFRETIARLFAMVIPIGVTGCSIAVYSKTRTQIKGCSAAKS